MDLPLGAAAAGASAAGVPTSTVALQVDERALWCVLATSVTTMLALAAADWWGRSLQRSRDEVRGRALAAMVRAECAEWARARDAVVQDAEELRQRVRGFQQAAADGFARCGKVPEEYLAERVATLESTHILSRLEAIQLEVEKPRMPSVEADEYYSDPEEAAPTVLKSVLVTHEERRFRVDLRRVAPTVMNLCLAIRKKEGLPVSRQVVKVAEIGEGEVKEGEILTVDYAATLPLTLVEVDVTATKAFRWAAGGSGGGRLLKTKASGYDVAETDHAVGLDEVSVFTVRLTTGNNELHDLGAGAPRFDAACGAERWLVSLYVEGGIASHDVPRLSAPGTVQTLLINGYTRRLSWYAGSYPAGPPCSTMMLLKKDFPLKPLIQTHGTGAEFEILDM